MMARFPKCGKPLRALKYRGLLAIITAADGVTAIGISIIENGKNF
jgi:hypothetical protein